MKKKFLYIFAYFFLFFSFYAPQGHKSNVKCKMSNVTH